MPAPGPESTPAAMKASYKVFLYDREYGDLTDAVTTDSFDAGVQLVRDRLPVQADYVVEATWTRGIGEMEVRSPPWHGGGPASSLSMTPTSRCSRR
jgi:hypothetical protein